MRIRIAIACAALTALLAVPAHAHIQVRPAQAAPGDPVLWTVLVPSEEESGTRQVELQIPKDVLPFSFEDQPGWTRTMKTNSDGTVASVVWKGQARGDGLVEFRFLASTPEQEGEIAFKALQTYRSGEVVRWIGAPGSENPAAVTTVSKSAPRENAGGEGEGDESAAPAAPAAAQHTGDAEDESTDWVARGAAIGGLLLGLAALVVALRRRTPA